MNSWLVAHTKMRSKVLAIRVPLPGEYGEEAF